LAIGIGENTIQRCWRPSGRSRLPNEAVPWRNDADASARLACQLAAKHQQDRCGGVNIMASNDNGKSFVFEGNEKSEDNLHVDCSTWYFLFAFSSWIIGFNVWRKLLVCLLLGITSYSAPRKFELNAG
jgi:hypothetical protein